MFCSECGAKLADSAKFCSACGTAVSQGQQQPVTARHVQSAVGPPPKVDTGTATIVIEMESQPFLLKLGKIQVLLDDQLISSDLWFGKTMKFTISEMGQHTVQIALKSVLTRSSEKISFQISAGQTLKFDGIYSNFGGGVTLIQV